MQKSEIRSNVVMIVLSSILIVVFSIFLKNSCFTGFAIFSVICFVIFFINLFKVLLELSFRRKFANNLLFTEGNFVFYHDVRVPIFLIIWAQEYRKIFKQELKNLINYLRGKGIRVSTDLINETVYVKFKNVDEVFCKDKDGNTIGCIGFVKGNTIEVEWDSGRSAAFTQKVVRHEIAHYLIDLVHPGLSEQIHHKIIESGFED